MASGWELFERITRRAHQFVYAEPAPSTPLHPFDLRNIHPGLPPKVRQLFDDGHYAEATFHAFKYLDKRVARFAGVDDSGWSLMMAAFNENNPLVKLTSLSNETEENEQKGFKHMFGGSVWAIRNPRGHEIKVVDDVDLCLDHLCFASLLLRRLDAAGYRSP